MKIRPSHRARDLGADLHNGAAPAFSADLLAADVDDVFSFLRTYVCGKDRNPFS